MREREYPSKSNVKCKIEEVVIFSLSYSCRCGRVNIGNFLPQIILTEFILFQIFVEFGSSDDSKSAAQALAGRKFANRVVVTSFYAPEMYHRKEFH